MSLKGAVVLTHTLFMLVTLTAALEGDEVPEHRVGEWEVETGFYQAIELTKDSLLYEIESDFQDMEVHQSKHYGKLLVLDGVLQIIEKDADSYNEMMAHIPMFQHPKPKRVLIIGGGDGYALVEVLKHTSVEHVVDHVDLDEDVVDTCKELFLQWSSGWDDPKVKLHIKDGTEIIQTIADGYYGVIIQDSSDPYEVYPDGTIEPLSSGAMYEESHFCTLQRILADDGVL